ncbi:hypothetical protein LINPERPRIM_LOCUS22134, partial [Linum perenne]
QAFDKTSLSQLFNYFSSHLQSTTLEQGASQSKGAWIEVHILGEELARGGLSWCSW